MFRHAIFDLFARSPFHPIQQHMVKVLSCVELMPAFMQAAVGDDWDEAAVIERHIYELEHEADELKKEILHRLPSGILTPVPRELLFKLVYDQDEVANIVDNITTRIISRQLVIPEGMMNQLNQFVQVVVDTTTLAHRCVGELDDLLETGFKGKEAEIIAEMTQEVEDLEDTARTQLRENRKAIYSLENQLNPLDAVCLYRVIDDLAELAAAARSVAMQLELMVVKTS
ncbi:TIGR00153 family protein [Spartinivicinus poritis]|uniref:TIGR00153 family protein n=1 Tax=Spartinivicinus poritis TaxID=2994640 RepID=A0ABT5UB60_9GAMM|nr:TIGR00153 family protein [Spartinivicinus sp. A2-2]MDE1463614.1 TIGR00153 family protein [Spartinivicinus sp. A2-2]